MVACNAWATLSPAILRSVRRTVVVRKVLLLVKLFVLLLILFRRRILFLRLGIDADGLSWQRLEADRLQACCVPRLFARKEGLDVAYAEAELRKRLCDGQTEAREHR
eukprot:TRINITY_DN728_c0_g2_i3.p2 TRINITY_DN728_c0_g2~~TRINITY_DN728_c0_g2_i3.p2  ORF type:complete len:107 (+),score=14.06 TRINITY_DN728_c0_g2_i3:367-687(+)